MSHTSLALWSLLYLSLGLTSCALPSEGTLVFGRGADSVGLDPARETDGESFKVCDNIYETLVTYKPESTSIREQLARSWEVSPNHQTWTFHLRTDVRFHDGTVFDANAMLFSLGRQFFRDHKFYRSGIYIYWESMDMDAIVADMRAANDSTLVIELNEPNAPFIANLAMNFCAAVSPNAVEKYGEDFFKHPVGTGPFRLAEWRKDERLVLERHEDYWGVPPRLERLIFKPIHDASVRFLELSQGHIDGLDNISPEFIREIENHPNLQLLTQPGMNVGYLAMNMDKKPFDDVRVRRALNHAIDKQALVDHLYQGRALPAKNPLPPTLWGYNNDVEAYAYNPDMARRLLAEAGYTDGFTTELWTMPQPRPYMPQPDKVAEAIQANLSAVDIDARIVRWEWGTYLAKVQNGDHPLALLGWTGDNGDPDNFLYVLLDKTAAAKPAQNIAFYRSEPLHDILVSARRNIDQMERAALYHRAQEIIHTDVPWVPLVHATQTVAFQRRVSGFRLHPTGSKWFHEVGFDP